jgi:hypothetical protein
MRWLAAAVFAAVGIGAGVGAQEPASAPPQDKPGTAARGAETTPDAALQPLKVSLVVSRYKGDKRIGSLPYVLGVTVGRPTSLRMGVDVPIVMGGQKTGGGPPGPTFSYRAVGTNIDCTATTTAGGLYNLNLVVEDSSVQLQPGEKAANAAFVEDIPSFRTFKSSFTAVMRDGQTMQYTSATDPVTGEVMKIDVTLTLLK